MATGSISLSGLLGGAAGQIDTTTLIAQLMQAQSLPKMQLQDQLNTQQTIESTYQGLNSKFAALLTAAQALGDTDGWSNMAATSSNPAVVATGSSTASTGSTTFSVSSLASAQVTTFTADASGNVITNYAAGITLTGADGTPHALTLKSGSATDVASAINGAGAGVRATVVNTADKGQVLQLTSTKTGAANGFTLTGLDSPATQLVAASDATVTVGDPAAGGYTVTSATNTFTNAIPGVTFSVNAVVSNVTVTVSSDESAISNKVQSLVDAANAASKAVSTATAAGSPLTGTYELHTMQSDIYSSISQGTSTGGSLSQYGLDIDKDGVISFDADTFAAAYANDPDGTKQALNSSFVSALTNVATQATDPTTGVITVAISDSEASQTSLTKQISDWTDKLATIQDTLTTKFTAMQTALAKLDSQQTYLTNMFKSMNSDSSSSSS